MDRAHSSAKNYLSVGERIRLSRQIEFEKRRLAGGIYIPPSRGNKTEAVSERMMHRMSQFMDRSVSEDPGLIKKKIQRLERVLSNGTPRDLSSSQRTRLEKKAQAYKEYLQKKMCPKSLYFKKSRDPEFEKAVAACSVERSSEFSRVAHDFKNLMRQLAPNDPDASNVEKLRPN